MAVHRRRPVVLVALLAGALALAAACTQDPEPSASDERTDRLARPGMHAIDPPPLSERRDEVRVAAGDRLLIWGGQSAGDSMTGVTFGDGAVLDVTTGRWSEASESPFPHGLFSATGVFDGEEFVIVGTECDEQIPAPTTGDLPVCTGPAAAAWDPSKDSWRRLPVPPVPTGRGGVPRLIAASPAVGSDGTAVFVDRLDGAAITWDRDNDRWGTVESPLGDGSWYCADPTQPWVVAVSGFDNEPGDLVSVLRPGQSAWSQVAPVDRRLGLTATCGGGRFVTTDFNGRDSSSAMIDPLTGAATEVLPDLPSDRVAEAVVAGPWLFVQTTPMPEIVGTTTTALGEALAGAQQRPDGRTMSVQLLPDGLPVPPRTESNVYTLTSPWATYVGRGIVICDLARPDECRMWVPPPEATPE